MNFSYILNQSELKLLLYSAGYTKVSGIPLTDSTVEFNSGASAINSLYKNNLIIKKGNGFEIEENLKRIIEIVGTSNNIMLINTPKTLLPDLSCYLSDNIIVICRLDSNTKGNIKLSKENKSDFINMLIENGYLPKNSSFNVFDDEQLSAFEKDIKFDPKATGILSENSKVIFRLSICDNRGFVLSSVSVIKYYLYDYYLAYNGKSKKRILYIPNNVKEIFEKYIFNLELL